ncbi:MAG: YbfB/YjiJ family MFS transporter [Microbacteriaceae bacterium]|nr:YbfB/YjiJ family MFS transporter [Microbacteriaceae bacterium]
MTGTQRSARWPSAASLQGALALGAIMGIGRFVFTPALGAMEADGVITGERGAIIASANYAGYLVGAMVMLVGRRLQRPWPFRISLLALAATMALMVIPSFPIWFAARFIAGLASAVAFVAVAQVVATRRGEGYDPGIIYAGLGGGVAVTGIVGGLTAGLPWVAQWWIGGALILLVAVVIWRFDPTPGAPPAPTSMGEPIVPRPRTSWWLLFIQYGLQGAGYIILGTFLVVLVNAEVHVSLGAWFWVVAGLVAMPSTTIWRRVADRLSPALALSIVLGLQTVAALLPVLVGGMIAALLSAALFGGTFIAAVMLATGMIQLGVSGAAARLTALYSVGQLLGPLAVLPLLGSGYTGAFAVAAGINGVAFVLSIFLVRSLRPRRTLEP